MTSANGLVPLADRRRLSMAKLLLGLLHFTVLPEIALAKVR